VGRSFELGWLLEDGKVRDTEDLGAAFDMESKEI